MDEQKPKPDIAQKVMIQIVGDKLRQWGMTFTGFREFPDGSMRATLRLGSDSEELVLSHPLPTPGLETVRAMQDKFCSAIRVLKDRAGVTA